jgi:hypothetical protein
MDKEIPEGWNEELINKEAETSYNSSGYHKPLGKKMWFKAYRIASMVMYMKMTQKLRNEMEMYKSCDPRLEEYDMNQQKVWIKFIADWQPGQINSGLGQALQDKFETLNKVSNGS